MQRNFVQRLSARIKKIRGVKTMRPTHNIVVPQKAKDSDNNEKTYWNVAGVGWEKENNINCKIHDGISINGSFSVVKRKEEETPQGAKEMIS